MTPSRQDMRAIRVSRSGGPEVLRPERIPVPIPGPGDVLVRVEAAGVNFIDVYKRSGAYRIPHPSTLGEEGCGTVAALGAGVSEFREGDRVAWATSFGAYAEYAVVPESQLVPVPGDVTAIQAAALMLQGMTAHYLAHSTWRLAPGDRCLIHAAAGGVGLLLVQMARRAGARVIATVGTDEKGELARAAGADDVIVYTRENFVQRTRELTGGAGVQVVYDSVGRSTFAGGLDVLSPRGMMVLFGQSSGAVEPFDPQLLNQKGSLFLTRPSLARYVATRSELLWRSSELFAWLRAGALSLRVGGEFPLEQAAEAHRQLESRRTSGKLVLVVRAADAAGPSAGSIS